MECVLCIEFRGPTDEYRSKQFTEMQKGLEKQFEPLIKAGLTMWADNTGTILYWFPFESMEKFAEFYGDMEMQKMMARASGLLDDIKIRLLRPGITISEL